MRLAFGALLLAIIFAPGICARIARHSGKRIGSAAPGLLMPLMPVTGNLIIVLSASRALSTAGCYLYYLGLDVTVTARLFSICTTGSICPGNGSGSWSVSS